MTYRKEPEAPLSAIRIYYQADLSPNNWLEASKSFWRLSDGERREWEQKAESDRARFEREKREYNRFVDVEEELLTDQEEEAKIDCGTGYAETRASLERQRCEQRWARYRRDYIQSDHNNNDDDNSKTLTTTAQGSSVSAPDPPEEKFPRFSDLPLEIRLQIYAHLFQSPKPSDTDRALRQWQLEYEKSSDEDAELRFPHLHPLDTRILPANQRIYVEALGILYASRGFVVDIARASIAPLFIQHATGLVPPRPSSKIRRWHLRVTFTDLLHQGHIMPQLELVHDVMKSCVSIDEVRFTWISVPNYWSELPGLRSEFEAMLGMFRDVRGVKRVVFTETDDREEMRGMDNCLGGCDNLHLASEVVRRDVRGCMESSK
ncbi:MAG: hypothetical protein Q9169_006101 [Polycauliona sp. 2 TL-2023]